MDQSYSDSDVSMSPTQVLERLQVLRQLQLLQRGKLQKQRLQYQETSETSSTITEIVSHFSNSTTYNTFRSLLQSPGDTSNTETPRLNTSNISQKVKAKDLIDGVSVLNLSQESEFIVNSPTSINSRASAPSIINELVRERTEQENLNSPTSRNADLKPATKKHIFLDDMPILTPKKDFEALVIEKLKDDKVAPKEESLANIKTHCGQTKKPFLRRGEGMARFGLKKNDLIIQNTKSLPWRNKSAEINTIHSPQSIKQTKAFNNIKENVNIQATEPKKTMVINRNIPPITKSPESKEKCKSSTKQESSKQIIEESIDSSNCELHSNMPPQKIIKIPIRNNRLLANKGKTWATVLTKEQNDFLRQLKQSDYYKSFASPAKSAVSDVSCDENMSKLSQEREAAEQNLFELLENKVSHESFNIENSFFHKFLRKNKLECSGESTPLILQKCLAKNPDLMHISPHLSHRKRNDNSQSIADTCQSDCTECCSDTCSSVSSCCSCKTVDSANILGPNPCELNKNKKETEQKRVNKSSKKDNEKVTETKKNEDDTVTENDALKANIVEMNAKLITTSELLKDRLCELEDEIETFRKENANLSKMREEIDLERQKFYEEKSAFEQKFNEEKVLSEYYLSEEKEKLAKQKQMYERCMREMRGRLNKKDRDEVINLKKEIETLKEEIRIKDAKTTSTIARLRNQIKIMEKEKKDMQDEVEKLKKENRRIQHSNDITRRLTNMKYLAEINKKLSNMTSKEARSEINLDSDIKYKSYEIERQSRSHNVQPANKGLVRPRAKSVPNLKVTSRYAKYFSQRDSVSQMERNKTLNVERSGTYIYTSDNEEVGDLEDDNKIDDFQENESCHNKSAPNNDENHLEKLYMETFRSTSPISDKSSLNSDTEHKLLGKNNHNGNSDAYFLRKSNSNTNSVKDSISPTHRSISPYGQNSNGSFNRSKSPISILSHRSSSNRSPINSHHSEQYNSNLSGGSYNSCRPKSPISIHSNHSSHNQRSATVIHNDQYRGKLMVVSPEPSTSTTSLAKTNLNPTEIRKPDGSRELRFPNGNIKHISADGKYSKFLYYNGDVKENFYNEGRIKYFYAETKTFHTTHADGLEVLEFPDGQVEKRYKDGSLEIRLPNGSVRYFDPKNEHVREEWRFPDGAALTVSANGEQRIVFSNGQVEVHATDHKRREFPDGTVKLVYNDGTSETRYASGRIRVKDKHGNLVMDSASR